MGKEQGRVDGFFEQFNGINDLHPALASGQTKGSVSYTFRIKRDQAKFLVKFLDNFIGT